MAPQFVLGIDKGTSVIKSVVFDASGTAVGSAAERVEVLRPQPGWHEEDPEHSWQATARTVRAALDAAGIAGADIAALGIAGHMGGAWIVDAAGRAVRNAICWPDERAQELQLALERDGALPRAFEISGNGLMPGITLMALAWLTRHEPQALGRAAAVLCAKDYLRLRLTGRVATDPSDVSFVPGDIDGRRFSPALMELCGAGSWTGKLPPVLESGAIAGTVTAEAAALTGLVAGTPVVTGLGDACANALGVGALEPGTAFTALGTSCLNSMVLAEPQRAPAGLGFLFAMPQQRYLRILPNTSGTVTMDWFLDRFGGPRDAAGNWDFATLERRAAAVPPGAHGAMLLPYVNGSGVLAPFFEPRARGAFFGVGSHTTHDHLTRAVYEALCFATRDCFAAMPQRPAALTLTGGGARSPFWAQMFANICGVPVAVRAAAESGALGVAMLAGVAAGLWPDLAAAQAATATVAARYAPDPALQQRYDGWFALWQEAQGIYRRFYARRSELLHPAQPGRAAA